MLPCSIYLYIRNVYLLIVYFFIKKETTIILTCVQRLTGSPGRSLGKFRSNPYIHNSVYLQQQTFQKEVKYFLLTAIYIDHLLHMNLASKSWPASVPRRVLFEAIGSDARTASAGLFL